MPYCSSCGNPIPKGQGKSCSMCYGDIDHGSDGYYRKFMEDFVKIRKLPNSITVISDNGLDVIMCIDQYDNAAEMVIGHMGLGKVDKVVASISPNYKKVAIFYGSGPCKGVGVRISTKIFKKLAKWFLSKDGKCY